MAFQKKDFIEIEFTGKIKDGDVFDSNIEQDLKTLNPNAKSKPFVFCLGEGMFLRGVEEFLLGKETGKYTIELPPEKAFGQRSSSMIQPIPSRIFKNQNVRPFPGAVFNFDGRIAKILSVSGGRVIADFNHPLSGKILIYDVNVIRRVENLEERLNAFIEFLFRKELKFTVEEKKLKIEVEKELSKFVEMFKDKFKDIFDLELEFVEVPAKEKQ